MSSGGSSRRTTGSPSNFSSVSGCGRLNRSLNNADLRERTLRCTLKAVLPAMIAMLQSSKDISGCSCILFDSSFVEEDVEVDVDVDGVGVDSSEAGV